MRTRFSLSLIGILLFLASCNLPTGQSAPDQPSNVQPVSDVDTVGTAVELTSIARLTQTANAAPLEAPTITPSPTFTPGPTLCNPIAAATVNANVRSGPSTDYDVVGSLLIGQTATVAGRNDANTWWYIDYPGASGGHAWIAGSVVTTSCMPAVVQIVAAPPLPTAVPAEVEPTEVVASGIPDLIVSEFTITPATPTCGANAHVRIGVYNQGTAASGSFTVVWYGISTAANPSCTWNVANTNAKGGRIIECDYAFPSWYPANKISLVIADLNNQVNESNEGNNQGTISGFGVNQPCP